jgi:hypothetical protein
LLLDFILGRKPDQHGQYRLIGRDLVYFPGPARKGDAYTYVLPCPSCHRETPKPGDVTRGPTEGEELGLMLIHATIMVAISGPGGAVEAAAGLSEGTALTGTLLEAPGLAGAAVAAAEGTLITVAMSGEGTGTKVEVEKPGEPPVEKNWKPADIKDSKNWNGCEKAAQEIKDLIGGEVKRITPADPKASLGPYRGVSQGWHHHEVVVKNGRVFDKFTGSAGATIQEYKALWEYAGGINFGF